MTLGDQSIACIFKRDLSFTTPPQNESRDDRAGAHLDHSLDSSSLFSRGYLAFRP